MKLSRHPAGAGYLLEWRQLPDRTWQALVEYVLVVPGFRGGMEPYTSWLLAHEVEPVPDEDYSRVPRTKAGPERSSYG